MLTQIKPNVVITSAKQMERFLNVLREAGELEVMFLVSGYAVTSAHGIKFWKD